MKSLPWDRGLFVVVLLLVITGLVMIYSASSVLAARRYGDSFYFLKQQFLWVLIGFTAMGTAAVVPYRWWKPMVVPLTVGALALLGLVLVPWIGIEVNGARRWISVGALTFQPSEFAKLVLVLYLAHYLVRHGDRITEWKRGLVFPLAMVGVFLLLVLWEPDLGCAVVMGSVAVSVLFLAGARLSHLAVVGIGTLPFLLGAILMSPYRLERFLTFWDPWKDPGDAGFQMVQSFLSLGSGGPLGTGLGAGSQKLFYLPEPHTDFIFAVIGEELGLVGTLFMVGCFSFLVWRGLRIAGSTGDPFGRFLGMGITLMIGLQALINMGVVTGLLPTKGLPLPFVSYGGSNLVICLTGVGMLLALSKVRGGALEYREMQARKSRTGMTPRRKAYR